MLCIRERSGAVWQVKPGTEILVIEFQINKEYRISFISDLSGRFIQLATSDVERIFNM